MLCTMVVLSSCTEYESKTNLPWQRHLTEQCRDRLELDCVCDDGMARLMVPLAVAQIRVQTRTVATLKPVARLRNSGQDSELGPPGPTHLTRTLQALQANGVRKQGKQGKQGQARPMPAARAKKTPTPSLFATFFVSRDATWTRSSPIH